VRFAIEHRFEGVDADAYAALFFDEEFSAALGRELRLGRELLALDRDGARIVRRVRCEPNQDPDQPEGKALGASRASFVEEIEYDTRAHRGTWRTIPNIFGDRLRTSGTLEVTAAGGGVTRIVRGEVDVRLFGLGRLVEKRLIAEIEKSYARAAAFTTSWLSTR
jgi:hypothetical protein